jgi:hypothetical protein
LFDTSCGKRAFLFDNIHCALKSAIACSRSSARVE